MSQTSRSTSRRARAATLACTLALSACFTDEGAESAGATSGSDGEATQGASGEATQGASGEATGAGPAGSESSSSATGVEGCTPSGDEVCDGEDNDCDGLIDEPAGSSALECGGCEARVIGSSAYWFCQDEIQWEEARGHCESLGAHLIILNSEAEQSEVFAQSPIEYFWLGLTDAEVEGTFRWVDGSTPADHGFENWPANDGNEGIADCVYTQTDSTAGWNIVTCEGSFVQWTCEAEL